MRIVTLIENTPGAPGCAHEHGLSLYVQTARHTLLLDTGATDAFAANAAALGLDLGRVDTIVLSHGHYDHGGGLLRAAALAPGARIYMQRGAGRDFYHGERYIGLDKAVLRLPGLCLLDGDRRLDEELFLFAGITGRRFWPRSNRELSVEGPGGRVQDDFTHEQCLVVTQGGRRFLLSGCAHNGILNILDRYRALFGAGPDVVVSGFHMKQADPYTGAEWQTIEQTARALQAYRHTQFYTGHCTGRPAQERLQQILGDQLRALHSGEELAL